jgi:hypothetical protein
VRIDGRADLTTVKRCDDLQIAKQGGNAFEILYVRDLDFARDPQSYSVNRAARGKAAEPDNDFETAC